MLLNPVDPFFGEPVIKPGMVGWLYGLKIAVLVGFLILFVLSKRPFCRTTCPLGAIYSLFNRIALMRMKVRGKCVQCIRCLECTVCKNVSVKWGIHHE